MRLWHLLCLLFALAVASFVLPRPSRAQPVVKARDPLESIPMWVVWEKRERRGSRRTGGAAPGPLRLRDLRRPGVSFGVLRPGASLQRHAPTSRGALQMPGLGDPRQPFDVEVRPRALRDGFPSRAEHIAEVTTTPARHWALSPPQREAGATLSLPPACARATDDPRSPWNRGIQSPTSAGI